MRVAADGDIKRGQQITPSPPTAPPPENRPHAATPPENRNTPQLPPAASKTGPSTPEQAPLAPAPRTVQQALQGFRDDVDTGKKGQTRSGETLTGILTAWWEDPEQQCFKSLWTAGPNLDCQTTWVHHRLFGKRN
mgnify:CR=1 FL=1